MRFKLLTITALLAMAVSSLAFAADDTTTSTSTVSGVSSGSSAQSSGGMAYQGQDQGQRQGQSGYNNGQGMVFDQSVHNNGNGAGGAYAPAVDLSRAVGIATAPALTTTLTETCMGSTSVGAGFSGGSFSFGTTWRDSACVRRLDARQVHSLGDAQAAKEVMCDSDLVRTAFKKVGRPCADDGGSYVVAVATPVVEAPAAVTPAPEVKQEVNDNQDARDKVKFAKPATPDWYKAADALHNQVSSGF